MSEERKMVLKMLEEGRISVDEAERLLHALNEKDEKTDEEQGDFEEAQPPSEFVDWERWDERKQTYKQQSSGFKISQYIENIIQKIKDVDFDLNFGAHESVKHIFQDHTDDFHELNIKIKNGSVDLKIWKDKYVQIDCDVKVYRVQSREEARQKFLNEVHYELADGTLQFSCDARDVKIHASVAIPEKMYEQVVCKLFNGNVSCEAIHANELKIKTVNGSLSFPQIAADKAELETGNGAIFVNGQADWLTVETINGAIEAEGMFRDFDAESFSGSITARLHSEGKAALKSTTSGITVIVPKDMQIHGELLSSIGSVQCELHSFEVLHEKKELAQRLLKFVSNKKAKRVLHVEANTKTGSAAVVEQED